ncbi:MAG TPA: hypothetical protein VFV14_11490 [Myxococcaceae bacterium]|nr:hypothetical protein [Myxococcaceae bacterium]
MEKTRNPAATQLKASESKGWRLNLSAIGLSVAFAAVAAWGAEDIAFEKLGFQVKGLRGEAAANLLGSVWAWTDTAGVATRARNLALDILIQKDFSDSEAIQHALDERVRASPTSAAAWQQIAAYQQAVGGPAEPMLAAFRMSALTGSHEGPLMNQRARFGLENWSTLTDGDRRTVIRDLLATAVLPEFRTDQYRAIIVNKTLEERDQIGATARASGLAGDDLLEKLGL